MQETDILLDQSEIANMKINEEEFFKNVSNCPKLLKEWWKSEDIFIKGKINPIFREKKTQHGSE